jgi:hypothetical protein
VLLGWQALDEVAAVRGLEEEAATATRREDLRSEYESRRKKYINNQKRRQKWIP